jgi:hypothetical protein
MREILENLFIGCQLDYETTVKNLGGWAVVHASKEPYHRDLLGYQTRGAPKNHPEYFFAERDDRLFLNLVDAPDPAYIPVEIIDKALMFIQNKLSQGKKVLVHCNQGMSRSAIIGFLYLAHNGKYTKMEFCDAEKAYTHVYPEYNPAYGVRGYAMQNWGKYCR